MPTLDLTANRGIQWDLEKIVRRINAASGIASPNYIGLYL